MLYPIYISEHLIAVVTQKLKLVELLEYPSIRSLFLFSTTAIRTGVVPLDPLFDADFAA